MLRLDPPPKQPWFGPPDDEVGVAVHARMVLASQPRLFIAVTDCVAYSSGFSLAIALRSKDYLHDAAFQIGIRFSDGQAALAEGLLGDQDKLPGSVISLQAAGGGGGTANFTYFIWPLPPDGPVTITCNWAARGLHAAGKEINGTAIRAAGLKSHSVWG